MADPTGLIRIFGWLSVVVCVLSGISIVVGAILRDLKIIIAALTGLAVGIGFGLVKGLIAQHAVWVYVAFGLTVAALVYLQFHGTKKLVTKIKQSKRKGPFDGLDPNRNPRHRPASGVVPVPEADAGRDPDAG